MISYNIHRFRIIVCPLSFKKFYSNWKINFNFYCRFYFCVLKYSRKSLAIIMNISNFLGNLIKLVFKNEFSIGISKAVSLIKNFVFRISSIFLFKKSLTLFFKCLAYKQLALDLCLDTVGSSKNV